MTTHSNVTIIGAGSTGMLVDRLLSIDNTVLVNSIEDISKPEPFYITNPTVFDEPWIDPNIEIPNYHKHKQSCIKNRKARKKRQKHNKRKH